MGLAASRGRSTLAALMSCALAMALAPPSRAELAPEPVGISETVGSPEPHWTFYQDLELAVSGNTRFVLIDGDDAEFLAQVSAGEFASLAIAPDASEIYVSETTYDYGSRGPRHDFVTVYDTTHYAPQAHIPLPTGKRAIMASTRRMTLLRDPRFLLVFNFTPTTSVSVVDLKERRHVVEVPVPGCSLLYPTGERGVSMLCGNGSMLTLRFDENGQLAHKQQSEPFFDPNTDPLKTNAVAVGSTWYFVSYSGDVYPVDLSGDLPVFHEPWALVDHDAEPASWLRALLTMGKAGRWLPGGTQLAAGHTGRGELYVIVHPELWSGGKGDPSFPGPEIWVYDVAEHRKVREIEMRSVASSVNVTQDDRPLLFVSGVDIEAEQMKLEIYDAVSGEFLREMHEHGDLLLRFQPVLGAEAFAREGRQ